MNTAETIVSCIFGALALFALCYAIYREAYYKGFDRAMKMVDEMHEARQKYNRWLDVIEEEIET